MTALTGWRKWENSQQIREGTIAPERSLYAHIVFSVRLVEAQTAPLLCRRAHHECHHPTGRIRRQRGAAGTAGLGLQQCADDAPRIRAAHPAELADRVSRQCAR